ncbi:MAG: hypothetical protein M0R77_08540 [Gammaproteobacteria bacterium]|nr:hypothetical protein [Gammaproteobacteria bacterium]
MASDLSMLDQTFLEKAAQDGAAEIEMAKLGADQKRYAAKIIPILKTHFDAAKSMHP